MIDQRSFFFLLTGCTLCIAAIRGTVTESDGTTPIAGVKIFLENTDITATTDEDGLFRLEVGSAVRSDALFPAGRIRTGLAGKVIWYEVTGRTTVTISLFTISGGLAFRYKHTVSTGYYRTNLPSLKRGTYLMQVESGDERTVMRMIVLGTGSPESVTSLYNPFGGASGTGSASSTTDPESDTINASKDGYIDFRMELQTYDTAGLDIPMVTCSETVRDTDGNVYHAVSYGSQLWTVENLRTTHYNDGTPIQYEPVDSTWIALTTGGYCCYRDNTDSAFIEAYGLLYNWYAVETGGLAPEGWRVPDTTDWEKLRLFLITNGYNWDNTTEGQKSGKAAASRIGWNVTTGEGAVGNNQAMNNRSGFSALPSGERNEKGRHVLPGSSANWWSTTERNSEYVYEYYLTASGSCFCRGYINYRNEGRAVRLVKDAE